MSDRLFRLALIAIVASVALVATACGDDAETPVAQLQPGQTALQPQALPGQTAAPVATPTASPTSLPAAGADPDSECRQLAFCEQRCKSECLNEEKNRSSYFAAKKAKIGSAPFEVKVDRIYVDGSCAAGDDPGKRKSTSGVKAIVDGVMTYRGNDMLYAAELDGEMYLRFDAERYAEAFAADRTYTGGWYRRVKQASRFDREVRGADPWVAGESRAFHWESQALSEAFCEVMPDEATVYVELSTRGINGGTAVHPLKFVPLNWEEVVGMAMRQQVNVITKKGKETVLEPADAIYSVMDKILVTRLTGSTQWLKRYSTVQADPIGKAPAASFPVSVSSDEWKVTVTGITQAKEFGGYVHKGEDQFLSILDVKMEYNGEESGSPKNMGFKLEVAAGKWAKPVSKAMGQIDLTTEVASGGSISGKVVFQRQRFQRPFRLEVKTPDKATLYMDVFSYDLGPERAPK